MRYAELVLMSVFAAGAAAAQGTTCDSPCKMVLLPLITKKDSPVPNSNPLAELQGKIQGANSGYFAYQVDKPVAPVPNGVTPHYPDSLKASKVEGEVIVAFVVDTLGMAELNSLKILRSTNVLFSQAVRDALPQMRFIPAELKGHKVRQLVQQPFVFTWAH